MEDRLEKKIEHLETCLEETLSLLEQTNRRLKNVLIDACDIEEFNYFEDEAREIRYKILDF